MKKVLLSLSLAAVVVLAIPAPAQPGPGPGPGGAPQQTPAANPPREPGPGFGFPEEAATPAHAPAATTPPAPAADTPSLPPVYDEAADAKVDVAAAVTKARREKKRVLVTLGGNWCGWWCRTLDSTFRQDGKVAAELAKAYVPVKVDVGKMTKNLDLAASWGADPKRGVPLLVVLDGEGKAVKVQETGALKAGKGYDSDKVAAFLKANAGR